MTAEVAVINKSAVAIAADSAVTITSIHGDNRHPEKIFNTANKVLCTFEIRACRNYGL